MPSVEILAPAGNPDALKTAINHGANAVYLGLQDFNARISADNFTTENIREYVEYAHLFGVKVYLTVNTLVNDDEMPKLLKTVESAVKAKVDAYLVQDFGVAYMLKQCFPNINLHASTQMGVHNLKGALVAQNLGFTRIVLSREAKLEDIIEIKKNTNLEIEYFVQGALCIAFSGNCYFSGMMQDESGNRGRCKQYCRMKYTANQNTENNTEKYLLSARDLCLLSNLKTLIDAGVTSFKIEGRLRRSGYVAQAVDSYVSALKALNNKGFNLEAETFKLKKVFSRGDFNKNAYLTPNVPDDIVNKNTQNHLGIEIGEVVKVERFKDLQKVWIKSSHKLFEGDGLKFLDGGVQICSLGVGNVEAVGKDIYIIYTKHKLKSGFKVNLILDNAVESALVLKERKIPFSVKISAMKDKKLQCVMQSGDVTESFVFDAVLEGAKNCPTSEEEIKTQFSKLGDTHFELNECKVETNGVFVPKSVLNNFRREAVKKLQNTIVAHNEQNIKAKVKTNYENLLHIIDEQNNNKLPDIIVCNEDNLKTLSKFKEKFKNNIIILSPTNYNLKIFDDFEKEFKGYKLGINLPIIANYKDLKVFDQILDNHKEFYVIANNIWGIAFAKTHKVIAGIGMNVFSDYSIFHLNKLGLIGEVLSIEQQVNNIKANNVSVYSLGFVPLMTFAHCPYKTINNSNCKNCTFKKGLVFSDVSKNNFPIRRYTISQCYFELLHTKLINCLGEVKNSKYIDLRELDEKQLASVLSSDLNTKIKLAKNETLGKIFASVK